MAKIAASAIQLKRAYEPQAASDGLRILVDRLWARGVSKETAALDAWMKELGPTDTLRSWFGHEPKRWDGFVAKYRDELATPMRQLLLATLHGVAKGSTITLVYGAHDTRQNEAIVLREYLLHDKAQPDDDWEDSTRLLVVVAVVAVAHNEPTAPIAAVKLFASPVLRTRKIEGTLQALQTGGVIVESSAGWRVTSRGQRQIGQLASKEA